MLYLSPHPQSGLTEWLALPKSGRWLKHLYICGLLSLVGLRNPVNEPGPAGWRIRNMYHGAAANSQATTRQISEVADEWAQRRPAQEPGLWTSPKVLIHRLWANNNYCCKSLGLGPIYYTAGGQWESLSPSGRFSGWSKPELGTRRSSKCLQV